MKYDATKGRSLGTHRVIMPQGALPQAAQKLDPSLPVGKDEILVSVSTLQIDSASFNQLLKQTTFSPFLTKQESLINQVQSIVNERGKMHNPVTNSGGVLLGQVDFVGPQHPLVEQLHPKDSVVSLVSLTLTPLYLTHIHSVDLNQERLDVSGHAFFFQTGVLCKIPSDLPTGVVLAALDICGAPAQVKRHVKPGNRVLILGLGKAGRSMALQAALSGAQVYGADANQESVRWCQKHIPGSFAQLDATRPLEVLDWLSTQTNGDLVSWVFNAVNIPDTEMTCIINCQKGGSVMFFGMNTSFQKAVLGAEGICHDVHLLMGSGYVPGHDHLMLNLLRHNPSLLEWFCESFA